MCILCVKIFHVFLSHTEGISSSLTIKVLSQELFGLDGERRGKMSIHIIGLIPRKEKRFDEDRRKGLGWPQEKGKAGCLWQVFSPIPHALPISRFLSLVPMGACISASGALNHLHVCGLDITCQGDPGLSSYSFKVRCQVLCKLDQHFQ